jgi:predicted TIM-barrel fold metal-dependent hydrolase
VGPTIPPIVSVDDHVVEPPHLWTAWLPKRLRDDGPRVVRASWQRRPGSPPSFEMATSGPETDFWVYEDLRMPIIPTLAAAGLLPEAVNDEPIAYDEMRAGCYDPSSRLADMDLNHTERSLCFPTFPRFCGQTFLEAKDRELAHACVIAYNDWMVEEWAGDSGGRLVPLGLIPLWDPVLAAAEVRRNADRGVRAVAFSEGPDALGLPSIYDLTHWDPFFTACSETGTAICIHVGSSSKPVVRPHRLGSFALSHVTAEIAVVDWFYSGALARFPALKLAFSESQVGWMPFLFQRIDSTWDKQRERAFSNFSKEITQPPSSYAAGRVFGCAFDDDFGIAIRGGPLGIDSLTFESDYPHTDSTWPNTKAYAEKALEDYSDEEAHKVIRGNAMRMLDLEDQRLEANER